MFDGFTERRIPTDGAEIALKSAGTGPPVLLVHGYPQTHAMWHKVAPALAERFTVVAADLRGYGASSKPPLGEDKMGYAKRTMAQDLVMVMAELGHERFAVVGHDRGGRVSYRMALDHAEVVTKLVTLDIIPTLEQFEQAKGPAARFLYHWYFLAQPHPLPERLIGAERDFYLDSMLKAWGGSTDAFTPEAMAAYHWAWADDEAIRASCDDYRAGATIDCELDSADRDAGHKITVPMLALWGDPKGNRNLLDTWSRWATDVTGKGLPCGHFIAEEAPDELLTELIPFLTEG